MGYFKVRYDSKVVIYDHRAFIRLATRLFEKNVPTPASFSFILSFQTHITNFTTNKYVKTCPSSIWYWDLNSQPLEHESPPITTRQGLPGL